MGHHASAPPYARTLAGPFHIALALALSALACGGDRPAGDDAPGDADSAEGSSGAVEADDAHVRSDHADDPHSSPEAHMHTNRLIDQKSPYLLQHAHNPVDWWPWCEEALALARELNKPIFLSIGYSTCHWCHVMERESFENEEIAALMNEAFVCIKVDREERPDLDQLYMNAVQGMTGSGGWPMTVVMTPELKPFFAGTYFPPEDRMGRPGMRTLVASLSDAWVTRRDQVDQTAENVTDALRAQATGVVGDTTNVTLDTALLDAGFQGLVSRFDSRFGGFGSRPKFPIPHQLRFLLRYAHRTGNADALAMARKTLDAMAMGGIHDHLAGGFHRYSVDDEWLVSHFEKMLYDQAGLALAYTDAWLTTGDAHDQAVARGILDYVLNYMTHENGGFHSAEDADSEGVEGKFYVWTVAEIDEVLGAERGAAFREAYDVEPGGNWEGHSILRIDSLDPLTSGDFVAERRELLARRDERIRPHLDDKILTAWNGFMIEAFAYAGRAFDEPRYLDAAERAAAFIRSNLWDGDRLLRHYRNGPAAINAYLEDYAYLGRGLVALYEARFDPDHLAEALRVANGLVDLFGRDGGEFGMYGHDAEELLAPVVEIYDGAMPSGNSAAAVFLLRVGHLTGNTALEERGWTVLKAFAGTAKGAPSAHLELLSAADFALGPITELVVAGGVDDPEVEAMWAAVREQYDPNTVRIFNRTDRAGDLARLIPFAAAQVAGGGGATAYVCRDYACELPVSRAVELAERLGGD